MLVRDGAGSGEQRRGGPPSWTINSDKFIVVVGGSDELLSALDDALDRVIRGCNFFLVFKGVNNGAFECASD